MTLLRLRISFTMTLCIVLTLNGNKYGTAFPIPDEVSASIQDIKANIYDQLISDGDSLHFRCQKQEQQKENEEEGTNQTKSLIKRQYIIFLLLFTIFRY
jgi:hypothetical protein